VPQWRFPYDAYEVPSLHVRTQAQGGPQIDLTGIVDSGASGTVLAREYAEKLGLAPADLREAGTIVVADGSKVRCWATDTPIRAQVLRPAISDDGPQPWGPVFAISPVFIEHADPLWGQADFFATFEVTFWRNATPATFGLSY
jgi:hypothetical protein